MLSNPIIMNHVRNYYYSKGLNLDQTLIQPAPNPVASRFLSRTGRASSKAATTRYRALAKRSFAKMNGTGLKQEAKLVLQNVNECNQAMGRFSLKRISKTTE